MTIKPEPFSRFRAVHYGRAIIFVEVSLLFTHASIGLLRLLQIPNECVIHCGSRASASSGRRRESDVRPATRGSLKRLSTTSSTTFRITDPPSLPAHISLASGVSPLEPTSTEPSRSLTRQGSRLSTTSKRWERSVLSTGWLPPGRSIRRISCYPPRR